MHWVYFPIIIWVGVVPGSLSGTKGVKAKLYKPVQTGNPTAQAIEPSATTLSLPICGTDTPNFEGTGGFFFIDSKHPSKLFLLTACHVLFHADLTVNEKHTLCSTSQVTKKVFLLSNTGKEIHLTHLVAGKQEDDEEAEEERVNVEHQEKDATRAVVEIDHACIDKTNFISNCIDYLHPANVTSFKYPGNWLLKFFDTILDGQMGKPANKTLNHNHNPVIMAIKPGGASGLMVRHLNTICSVLRYYFKGELGQSSREVAVYPHISKSGTFSEPSDSGSVIINNTGRVMGILTSSAGATELLDCTYVTSINFLIKHLQTNGYKPNIFPTADNL
ncbi:hypothetical protein FRC06_004824 [Ceratobasidium sp. 370]|nr:hypothetical protein FRC06_004824 [Ceratobasidium sp. 370]